MWQRQLLPSLRKAYMYTVVIEDQGLRKVLEFTESLLRRAYEAALDAVAEYGLIPGTNLLTILRNGAGVYKGRLYGRRE